MATDNVVMWVTRLSVVDWVYSKTQTLLATLRTRNQPRVESYVSSEAEHSFPSAGCARSKRQCLTVPQNRKLFLWMLVSEWTENSIFLVSNDDDRQAGLMRARTKSFTLTIP